MTSYTALSSSSARSRTALHAGSSPPASAYPAQNASPLRRTQSLGQRAGGLALEVEHHPAGLGPHHLAQVVVAVHPLGRHRLGQLGQAGKSVAAPVRAAGGGG